METSSISPLQSYISETLNAMGFSLSANSVYFTILSCALLLTVAVLSYSLTRFVIYFKISKLVKLTSNQWDDEFLKQGVFKAFAQLVPGLILYFGQYAMFVSDNQFTNTAATSINLYLGFIVYIILNRSLSAADAIYLRTSLAKKAPITGFIQVARLIISISLIFFVISVILGKSPVYLLSGLTAIAAVLLLIFRDTILGFVAGIQIAANRMFNTGDWIEIPKYNIDGDILEIGLTVVKVQNWDKTISTIPTHALTADAVKNWRGMQESGGRRIKRSINIDLRSIRFANADNIEAWSKISLIEGYIKNKHSELQNDESRCMEYQLDTVNSRKLTNIGTLRAYIEAYLENHSGVNQNMTRMVRQLAPNDTGLPIEIYCFSNNQNWVDYENLQSDIFDHILAILPLFYLIPYQRVTNNIKKSNT